MQDAHAALPLDPGTETAPATCLAACRRSQANPAEVVVCPTNITPHSRKLLGAHGKCQCDPTTRDAGAPRAAVGNEHIAINQDGTLAEFGEVNGLAQRASDEALNLMGAAAKLAADRFTIGAGVRRARQHAVFGGDPAGPLAAKVWRHALFNRGRADHDGVAD